MNTKLILLICSLFIYTISFSQEGNSAQTKDTIAIKSYKGLRLKYNAGNVLPSNDFMRGNNASGEPIDYFQALAIEFNIQTTGTKDWEHLFKLPYYGIGFYNANFFASEELGTPTALYYYFGAPFKRWNRLSINYEWGFGLTWNWNPYNQETNPFNIAIGSHKTVYINAGLNLKYKLSSHFDVGLGYAFTHFSNGSSRTPNMGINMMAPSVDLTYNFKKTPLKTEHHKIEKYKPENEIAFFVAIGSKQIVIDTNSSPVKDKYWDQNFPIFDLSAMWQRQFYHRLKSGFGVDFSYDGSISAQYETVGEEDQYKNSANFAIGGYWGFEWVINNLSIVGNAGVYLLRADVPKQKPAAYQRLGVKYHFNNDMFAGINVRTYNYGIADFIEWNVGYRFRYGRKE